MAYTTLPWSMEQDRQNQIKASSTHVDDNFNTLLSSLNNKMDKDGSVTATADMPMGSHKITGLATPTASGDATNKGYVDNKVTDLDNRTVKITGDQEISGTKTFSNEPYVKNTIPHYTVKNTDITRGTAVTTNKYSGMAVRDKDNKELGYVRHAYVTSNNVNYSNVEIIAMDPTGNGSNTILTVVNDGTPANRKVIINQQPAATSATNETSIATTGWVNNPAKSTNVVHQTGDENIGGYKIFTSNRVMIQNALGSGGTRFSINDSNGKGYIREEAYYASSSIINRVLAHNNTSGKDAYLDIVAKDDGTSYASFVGVDTPGITSNDKTVATTAWVRSIIPAGVIVPYAGTSAPSGWLVCDGSAPSRTTYKNLFDAIGTTYGAGNGSTTFNLPQLHSGQVPIGMQGEYIGQTQNGCLPDIWGKFDVASDHLGIDGAFAWGDFTGRTIGGGAGRQLYVDFRANRYNSMYGGGWFNGTKVIPSGTGVMYIIKY